MLQKDKIIRLISLLKDLIIIKFTGRIIIHFGQGGICNVEKNEVIELK